MQKKSEPRSTGRGSKPTRKKTTSVAKKKGCGKEKDTIFLGTCMIEGAHLTVTRLGREIEDLGFKTTYAKLKKLYEELD
jgi:hypothetical protein